MQKTIKKVKRIIKSTYMCLKYPFLYPRNRFTDKHCVNLLHRPINKLYKNSIQEISITGKLVKEKPKYLNKQCTFLDYKVELNVENKTLKINNKIDSQLFDLSKIIWDDDIFEIVDLNVAFGMFGRPIIQVYIKPKDENDDTNWGFSYYNVKLITNKRKYRWYKIIKWIDEKILDNIFILPSYNEWDAMPAGWKKAFGKQYLKELKAQLKKDKMLYKFRIMDLKEKYGTLRLYVNYGSEELYNIINKYESLSYRTCIKCGKPATKHSEGWICPYCDDCYNSEYFIVLKDSKYERI